MERHRSEVLTSLHGKHHAIYQVRLVKTICKLHD